MSRGDALYQSYKNYPVVHLSLQGQSRLKSAVKMGSATSPVGISERLLHSNVKQIWWVIEQPTLHISSLEGDE